jgi:hypothetical protein
MKLRIRGNSLRFRTTRSEVAKLIDAGRIEETVFFAAGDHCKLTYALELGRDEHQRFLELRYRPSEIVIVLPTEQARPWAEGNIVGIYHSIDLGIRGPLELIVEKDFACLDGADADSVDTFPNPNVGATC